MKNLTRNPNTTSFTIDQIDDMTRRGDISPSHSAGLIAKVRFAERLYTSNKDDIRTQRIVSSSKSKKVFENGTITNDQLIALVHNTLIKGRRLDGVEYKKIAKQYGMNEGSAGYIVPTIAAIAFPDKYTDGINETYNQVIIDCIKSFR